MGLSRNKVAVSEGAAGSPPFYGESTLTNTMLDVNEWSYTSFWCSLFNFEGSLKEKRRYGKDLQYGGVAQLGEHLPCKQGVMGSNPIISTSTRGCAAIKRFFQIARKVTGPPQIMAHSSGG